MSTWHGTVRLIREWTEVSVEAENEDEANTKLSSMTEAQLNDGTSNVPDEEWEIDDLECIDGCEDEEDEDR